jgi:DNA-binding Xre family transcriptional regulator
MRFCLYCSQELPKGRHGNATTCSKEHSEILKKLREKEKYEKLLKDAGRAAKPKKPKREIIPIVSKSSKPYKIFDNVTKLKYPEVSGMPQYCIPNKENVLEKFGRDLSKYAKDKNLKIPELSKITGVDIFRLRDILKGRLLFDIYILEQFKNTIKEVDCSQVEAFFKGEINMYVKKDRYLTIGEYIGHIILEYRRAKNMTQVEFAKNVNFDNGYLSKIESGKYDNISIQLLHHLCTIFQCSASDILKF